MVVAKCIDQKSALASIRRGAAEHLISCVRKSFRTHRVHQHCTYFQPHIELEEEELQQR